MTPKNLTSSQTGRFVRLIILSGLTVLLAAGIYCLIIQSVHAHMKAELEVDTARFDFSPDRVGLSSDVATAARVETPDVWPNLFGPAHDNSSSESILTDWSSSGPPILWEMRVGQGYSSPIVWQDHLIIMHRVGDEEIIACVDSTNGSPRWEHRTPTAFECKSHYTNGPYSTPATDGDLLFTVSAEGLLQCLILESGSIVWAKDLKQEYHLPERTFGVGHSPLIWRDKVILNVGGTGNQQGIVAFSKFSGDVLWSATRHGASYATPQPARIHNQDFLFVLTNDAILSLDPADGTVHWEIPFQAPIVDAENAVTPLIYGDIALFCSYGNGTKCLRILEDGSYELLWDSKRALTSQFSPLVCVDEHVYGVHTGDFTFRCIELTSGKVLWRQRTNLQRATDLRVGDRLILFGEFGHLAAMEVNPTECRIICETDESLFDNTQCFSAPAVANGRLYLRNEQTLRCLDLSP